jgi:cytochrome P450/NADPH-cytochrome P450 reductase
MYSRSSVPQPPRKPVIGHFLEISPATAVQDMMRLARIYGPIYWFEAFGQGFYVLSSQELVDEVSDEKRFRKCVHTSLVQVRPLTGDGLFTAYNQEPNWEKAHRILMPAFGPLGVRAMFGQMLDIANQMFVKWDHFGPSTTIDVSDQMTRLTLDTIALCAFDDRFNSFYKEEMHPFVDAMVGALEEAGKRDLRPQFLTKLMVGRNRKFDADINLIRSVARQLIDQRRREPHDGEAQDLLDRMLNSVDPVTGERLDEENIIYQMITFLIAGHETTSGALSFATYFLLKNPQVLEKARKIVDEVVGDELPRLEHLAQLRYIEQILMETLRIWPTAPAFAVNPIEDTVLGGKYPVGPSDTIFILTPSLHRDEAVWGKTAEEFRPERFALENAEDLPPNAWKPFGNGARACIGRLFAMQEAQLVLTMLIQRFDFAFADSDYQLKIKETLTLKPDGLFIKVRARQGLPRYVRTEERISDARVEQISPDGLVPQQQNLTPLLVLYGSNTGSSEAFAKRIAGDAAFHGFLAQAAPLNDYAGALHHHAAVVIVTASYEGQPPDNATSFVPYAEKLAEGELSGLSFAVLGCGNKQWARTYQAIPKRIDDALSRAGANRLLDRGAVDSGDDFFGAFETWYKNLWPSLAKTFNRQQPTVDLQAQVAIKYVGKAKERLLNVPDFEQATVVENRELVDLRVPGARSKRHIELALPEVMNYRAGDYLAVLPRNPKTSVERALRRLQLHWDTYVVIEKEAAGLRLPVGQSMSCGELLSSYVELAQPATRGQVERIAHLTACPPEKNQVVRLAADDYEKEVLAKRLSVIDLLERFASADIRLESFLGMLSPLKARQYSISSSPLWNTKNVTLTVAVVDAPALSGIGKYQGVASTYLSQLSPGDRVLVATRPSNIRFQLPSDASTPIIMICAGSGIAPFRGFLQERSLRKKQGIHVGPALLFFGIDDPDVDFLYREELSQWEQEAVVRVMSAYSERPEGNMRYVQDVVWAKREEITRLFSQGAIVYVCGDGKNMAPAVRSTLVEIYRTSTNSTQEEADLWADTMERERGRYVADIFI